MYIAGQIISFLGMGLSIFSYQCRENKKFFIVHCMAAVCFAVSFLLVGSTTAAVLNVVNIFRAWVFGFAPVRYRGPLGIAVAAVLVLSTVLTYEGWLSILVLLAQLVGTVAMYTDNGKVIRVTQLAFVSPAWLTHNIFSGSIGAILCELFAIASTVISLVRFRATGFESAHGKEK